MSVIERQWNAHGFDCLVALVNQGSHRNGYTCVPEWHLYYGIPYWDIPIEVHGGLTFSDTLEWLGVPGWWIGFDCAHLLTDVVKRFPRMPEDLHLPDAHWWTEDEVAHECNQMAEQLAGLQPADPGSTYNEAKEKP